MVVEKQKMNIQINLNQQNEWTLLIWFIPIIAVSIFMQKYLLKKPYQQMIWQFLAIITLAIGLNSSLNT